ncbi:hemerythrin domain-containing protein [Aestuariirhabdus litorea]|uniref:Hemerythrin domain-containing protein n=1 Tax=Aestuariirhabdus litorea TaxID=2528527 RepID=A0A3P3VSC1_9GAMM|nr:hemerythrin domain-containing protein [Aestuariirhabdus litorea]RRJ85207.1 hemerythrin domain-containing protein [Aestuariirhabdus litorea]RWW98428.1 hemerythrin domain-containing protein [Endozoicomonadaceae bacterium GTF-13]
MPLITDHMSADHRRCDALFSSAENHADAGRWAEAQTAWQGFSEALEAHLGMEEQVLFPAFEAATGMSAGPTAVMRMEHQQMRALLAEVAAAAANHSRADFLSSCETLMVMMQQHNMKEEQILYPMADRSLPDAATTLQQMRSA